MQKLIIGSRKSDLARIQAFSVGEKLMQAVPSLQVEYVFSSSFGDQNLDLDLSATPDKGVFTQDFVEHLRSGQLDLVVHSWKDLPVESRPGLKVVATLQREDIRDVLLIKKSSWQDFDSNSSLKILSSSPRRVFNLSQGLVALLPKPVDKIEFFPVRGNIATRVSKLFASSHDGLVVAKAALDRILSANQPEFLSAKKELRRFLDQCHFMVLPISINPTAAAQGGLAIEVNEQRSDLIDLLSKIDSPQDFQIIEKEREILKSYGGGCHQKIGISCLTYEGHIVSFLKGLTDAGEILNSIQVMDVQHSSPEESPRLCLENLADCFERQQLDINIDHILNRNLFVAKMDALPQQVRPSNRVVVCSGIKTWKKLAALGHWVHACSDGLGGRALPDLKVLLGEEPNFIKLSHKNSSDSDAEVDHNLSATYEMRPPKKWPDISCYTHFYWTSGYVFKQAVQRFPNLVEKKHACGLGKTFETLKQYLPQQSVEIFYSKQEWIQHYNGA